jgi:hypothetical protein
VEVVRDREVYDYSWFPATVAKVIDNLNYLIEYADVEVEQGGGGKAMEYLHCLFIRPNVEHSPRESEFQLSTGYRVSGSCPKMSTSTISARSGISGVIMITVRV